MLVLASASPRRAELLRAAGIAFEVAAANIDESILPGETPEGHVRRLAAAKAGAVADGRPVLGADTVVVVDGAVLGKPVDTDDARRMLRLLSGRTHQVLTGVCLGLPTSATSLGGAAASGFSWTTDVAITTVEFAPLSDREIEWYVASGEPMDKAGAYAIQGLAARFVTRVDGSYSNVVGLPVALVYRMCAAAGLLVS
jgi:septum formation protein